MKKMFKFILILLVVGLGYYFFTKNQIEIPNSMVNVAVKSKFPIEKSYPAGKIKLYNPKTKFENNKLIINAEYLNDALNDKISGTMTFETDLEYDFMNSKLYLNNLKLVDLTKEGEKIDISKKPIIRTGLNIALNQLEKKEILDLKQIEKFQLIKDINIENNKVVVIK
ncbi:MAG: DUF1439 domain-containing protein [Leptotrichiaceae bacterium]|nr:DUF1439 domain-containing protein [Leptotrichiaceae bacterium]MBP7100414.1 DUF1439 domain-containing protein [Leptotrichiaceae bacterium]MBP7739403.1 DUF1439 domain-containing protein [Leptotrichiaceae bacterium]MBP9629247.1 DUF1439 domain-containing protein [Leptotrichiaceae bacterium]